jgi:signal transduction histidine kinase
MQATHRLQVVEPNHANQLKPEPLDLPAALSHNLKSPLVGTDMILNSLLREAQGILTSQQRQSLALIKDSNRQLLDMVQRLIDICRFETNSAELNFQPEMIHDIINESIANFHSACTTHSIKVSHLIAGNIIVRVDRQAFKKLFDNLLDNAVRHTPSGGIISISADIAGKTVEIMVRDTGCGIDLENPNILLHQFWQGQPGKSYSAVTGLGLYLCRQIVEAHAGQIHIKSQVNSGTVIQIVLPLNNH